MRTPLPQLMLSLPSYLLFLFTTAVNISYVSAAFTGGDSIHCCVVGTSVRRQQQQHCYSRSHHQEHVVPSSRGSIRIDFSCSSSARWTTRPPLFLRRLSSCEEEEDARAGAGAARHEVDPTRAVSVSSLPFSHRLFWVAGFAATSGWFATAQATWADSPDWGLFEGRTGSLLHPTGMICLLLYSLSTALLGFQWRRQRTIGDEIKSLQQSLPDLQGAASISDAITAARTTSPAAAAKANATTDTTATTIASTTTGSLDSRIAQLEQALPIEERIKELQQERKSLIAAAPRDKHFSQGALLAFLGTTFAIEGPLNTYARAGKLFPGPHLYVGAGLVVAWALAAACVPAMQKGNDTARSVHIGANLIGMSLFGWQAVTGLPILLKVVELTRWP